MKLSNNTLSVLKWMSTINGGIKIDPGNELYSKSFGTCVYVQIDEEFPSPFVTTNLQKFLATANLFDEPNFEFSDKSVVISSANGKNVSVFYQSEPACVLQPNRVPKQLPPENIALQFHIKSDDLQKIFKAATVMGAPDIRLKAKDGLIKISCLNKEIDTTDTFDVVIGECDQTQDNEFYFKRNEFKILVEFSYDVVVFDVGFAKFSAIDSPFKQFEIYSSTEIKEK